MRTMWMSALRCCLAGLVGLSLMITVSSFERQHEMPSTPVGTVVSFEGANIPCAPGGCSTTAACRVVCNYQAPLPQPVGLPVSGFATIVRALYGDHLPVGVASPKELRPPRAVPIV